VHDAHGVEGDVDAASLGRDRRGMLLDRLLVESVNLRGLGGSASGNDVLSDRFDRCPEAPGEKELGTLRRKGTRDIPPITPPAP
jgi:hypothetical protein